MRFCVMLFLLDFFMKAKLNTNILWVKKNIKNGLNFD